MESLFEKFGGTYSLAEDGMYYPEISIPKSNSPRYSKYGCMRLRYLQEHRPLVYRDLILQVKLIDHLNEIDHIANVRLELLIHQMQEQQGITEELKARDQLAWVGLVNNCQARADEVILAELIYV